MSEIRRVGLKLPSVTSLRRKFLNNEHTGIGPFRLDHRAGQSMQELVPQRADITVRFSAEDSPGQFICGFRPIVNADSGRR